MIARLRRWLDVHQALPVRIQGVLLQADVDGRLLYTEEIVTRAGGSDRRVGWLLQVWEWQGLVTRHDRVLTIVRVQSDLWSLTPAGVNRFTPQSAPEAQDGVSRRGQG